MPSASQNGSLVSYQVYFIPLSILVAKVLEVILRFFDIEIVAPADTSGNQFVSNFIEWFGVLYGILLPLILVRVWEQLDDIDREFDREADAVRILYKDLAFLPEGSINIKVMITQSLQNYVQHVIANYTKEIKPLGSKVGDEILEDVREQVRQLINPVIVNTTAIQFLYRELFERVNEIVDIRGDRIGLTSQRLFESLRLVALITSIIFILPFYFVGLTSSARLLDVTLVAGITLLVVFIFIIIEDLDEPFSGTYKISVESWIRILEDMEADKPSPKSRSSSKKRKSSKARQKNNKKM